MDINKNFIQIFYLEEKFDSFSKSKKNMIKVSGYKDDYILKVENIYEITGNLDNSSLNIIAEKLLIDNVIQSYEINSLQNNDRYKDFFIFDVWPKKGVTDSVGETVKKSIKTLRIDIPIKVKTGKRYIFEKKYELPFFENIIEKLFVNSVINEYFVI